MEHTVNINNQTFKLENGCVLIRKCRPVNGKLVIKWFQANFQNGVGMIQLRQAQKALGIK